MGHTEIFRRDIDCFTFAQRYIRYILAAVGPMNCMSDTRSIEK